MVYARSRIQILPLLEVRYKHISGILYARGKTHCECLIDINELCFMCHVQAICM